MSLAHSARSLGGRKRDLSARYGKLFMQHIKQANEGCDFDFLEGTAPSPERRFINDCRQREGVW